MSIHAEAWQLSLSQCDALRLSTSLAALTASARKPWQHRRMNPKALPRHQLLGCLNLDTREWADGVLTAAARRVAKEPPEQASWVVCDGDVDPEWIESLNSVLDDNRQGRGHRRAGRGEHGTG